MKVVKTFTAVVFIIMSVENGLKTVSHRHAVVATYSDSQVFRGRRGEVIGLATSRFRFGPDGEQTAGVTPADFITLPFQHPERRQDQTSPLQTAGLAGKLLEKWRTSPTVDTSASIEVEGNLVKERAGSYRLVPKYDGTHFSAANDPHPEKIDSMVEVATGTLPDGSFPKSPVEVARSLAKALREGLTIAEKRQGLFVIASAPEGGDHTQVRATDHPYIINAIKNTPVVPWTKQDIPTETLDICKTVNLDSLIAVNATHVHTDVPKIEGSDFLDPRIAHAKAQLRLTQFAKLIDFPLFNTKDYLGNHLDDVTDVRSYMRRTYWGARDAHIPPESYDYFQNAAVSMAEGEIPAISRYPFTGQHDRLRIKEFGTIEAVDSPANPDTRLLLTKAFANQILDVFALEALVATEGNEAEVLPYLQKIYGPLFEELPTMDGPDSTYQQDKDFNRNGFNGQVRGVRFGEYMHQARTHIARIGREYQALRTQTIIVDHVLGKVTEEPKKRGTITTYMNIDNPMSGGILTDYLGPDIDTNMLQRAQGTEKQVAVLEKIQTERDLFRFFKIPTATVVFGGNKATIL